MTAELKSKLISRSILGFEWNRCDLFPLLGRQRTGGPISQSGDKACLVRSTRRGGGRGRQAACDPWLERHNDVLRRTLLGCECEPREEGQADG